MKLAVKVTAAVNPTESMEKVVKAVLNIFPKASVEKEHERVTAIVDSLEGLEKLRMIIRSRRIRNTARMLLSKNISGNTVTFYLNKQAAYVGRLSFFEAGEVMALGPIEVRIESDKVEETIRWLTE
ncbi:MAG: RNA-binding domain-containing protein [Candidatus Caldarchaeum sp.]